MSTHLTPHESSPSLRKWIALLALIPVVGLAISTLSGPDDEILTMALQSDGKVVVGGKFSPGHIARLNSDGTADSEFSKHWSTGAFNGQVNAIAIQSDSKIVVAGEFTSFDLAVVGYLARLNADGTLDTAFATAQGTGFDDRITAIQVLSDGKILVTGDFRSFNGTSRPQIARLNSNGTLDEQYTGLPEAAGRIYTLLHTDLPQKLWLGGDFTSLGDVSAQGIAELQESHL